MQQNKNPLVAIILILLIQLLFAIEMGLIFPLTPAIAEIYSIATYQVAYMNIGNAVLGIFAPVIGYLADKKGDKKMIAYTIFIFLLGSLTIQLVPGSIIAYVIGRSLTGLAFFTIMGLGLNYLAMLVDESRLGFISGLYKIAFSLGVLISPFFGIFFINNYSFSLIYFSLSVLSAILLLLFLLFTPETKQTHIAINKEQIITLIKGKKERKMIIITFLLSTPAVFFFNYLSVFLDSKMISVNTIATLYTIMAVGSIIGCFFIMLFADKIGKLKTIIILSLCIPLAFFGFYINNELFLLLMALVFGFLYDGATGLIMPIGSMVVKHYKGTFLTILSLTMSLTNVVSNIVAPSLYEIGGFLTLIIIMSLSIFMADSLLSKIN